MEPQLMLPVDQSLWQPVQRRKEADDPEGNDAQLLFM